jgi:hypothetical protein
VPADEGDVWLPSMGAAGFGRAAFILRWWSAIIENIKIYQKGGSMAYPNQLGANRSHEDGAAKRPKDRPK